MRTVWAWQVVQGSRNSEWLLIHFLAMREGQVYYLHSGYGETDENMASGQPKKKCCWSRQNKKSARKIALCCFVTLSCERI